MKAKTEECELNEEADTDADEISDDGSSLVDILEDEFDREIIVDQRKSSDEEDVDLCVVENLKKDRVVPGNERAIVETSSDKSKSSDEEDVDLCVLA